MMTSTKKEIAKFFSGFEAFHGIVHGYLYVSGTNLTVLGIAQTPAWNLGSATVNVAIAIALGFYAWRREGTK